MRSRLVELAGLFLKLGTIGFGGPAAHIAMMEDEVVTRRGWFSRQELLDMIGATNLIPGPNSTELAIHIGHRRAGMLGILVAGTCFILPAVISTTLLAYFYARFGSLSAVEPMLNGIKPAVLAIIVMAGYKLGGKALKSWQAWLIAVLVAGAVFTNVSLVWLLFGGAALGFVLISLTNRQATAAGLTLGLATASDTAIAATPITVAKSAVATTPVVAVQGLTIWKLFLVFLKIGAILYGSGYVLIAYLQGELVEQRGWLSEGEVLDAVAMGQFTPGPILTTATFIGFIVMYKTGGVTGGIAGATVATCGIFLPSFLLVAFTGPLIPKLRSSKRMGALLDAVNAASMGLMAAVVLKLNYDTLWNQGEHTLHWARLVVFAVAMIVCIRWKVSSAWIVLGGLIAGVAIGNIG